MAADALQAHVRPPTRPPTMHTCTNTLPRAQVCVVHGDCSLLEPGTHVPWDGANLVLFDLFDASEWVHLMAQMKLGISQRLFPPSCYVGAP